MKKEMYTGLCVGGPLDGQQAESRCPKGFVLVDKPNKKVWVYDFHRNRDGGAFYVREEDVFDADKATRAANEPNYDVRAMP